MKYKEIKLEGNKSVLVDESAEIKEDMYIVSKSRGVKKVSKTSEDFIHYSFCREKGVKIIATINHSISLDVPMVVMEDEVEKLAKSLYKEPLNKNGEIRTQLVGQSNTLYGFRKFLKVFKIGYKAAQQKYVYSEEDLRVAINKAYLIGIERYYYGKAMEDEIIQSLNQEYIELEMEDDGGMGYPDKQIIKTNRVNGQLMAYETAKNGLKS